MRLVAVLIAFSCLIAACSDDGGVRSDLTKLSGRGLYRDIAARKVVARAFEYRPDYGLWSDGAEKRRWIVLPEGRQVDTSDMAHWVFPLGTKFFKEFSRNGKKLETRLVERVKETGYLKNDYFMATFIWRADQSDAILTAEGRDNVLGTEHDVPKQKACIVCHQGEPGGVLGFSAVQLSASGTLAKIERKGWLSDAPGRTFEFPGDEVQKPALGSMHANCGHCHSETGMADFMHLRFVPEEADRRFEELDAYKTTVGVELSDEWEDHPPQFERRVVPGDPDASAIAYRMGTRGDDELAPDQMPPLATRKVDEDGLAAVRKWIESLAGVVIPDGRDAGEPDAGEVDAGLDAGMPAADGGGPVSAGASGGGAGVGGGNAGSSGPVGPGGDTPPVVQPAAAGSGDSSATGPDGGSAGESGSAGSSAAADGGADASVDAGPILDASGEAGSGGSIATAGVSGSVGAAGYAGSEGVPPDVDASTDEATEHDASSSMDAAVDRDAQTDEAAREAAEREAGAADQDAPVDEADRDGHADEGADGHG
jgi:hypothetical protein